MPSNRVTVMSGDTRESEGQRSPALVMAACVPFYAVLPWLISKSVSESAIQLDFVGVWFLAFAVVSGVAVRAFPPIKDSPRQGPAALVRNHGRVIYVVLGTALSGSWLLFVLASQFTDIAVVTVVWEFWPVLFALFAMASWFEKLTSKGLVSKGLTSKGLTSKALTFKWLKSGASADRSRIETLALLLIAGVAVSVAVLSEHGESGEGSSAWILGTVLACVASASAAAEGAVAALAGKDTRQAAESRRAATESAVGSGSGHLSVWSRVAISTSTTALARLVAGLALVGGAVALGGFPSGQTIWLGVVVGICEGCGNLVFNAASQLALGRSAVQLAWTNSIYYAVPVGALALLGVTGSVDLARPEMLVVGGAGVIAINMIMHLDPEGTGDRSGIVSGGHGYRAVVIALWACGAAVTFREDWVPDSLASSSVVEYWAMIGTCATVFVLIMSFRASRLAERRALMDEMMLRLHSRVLHLDRTHELRDGRKIASHLRRLDTAHKPGDLRDRYLKIRKRITVQQASRKDPRDQRVLEELMTDINVFTNLRQQGRNFAERAVMVLFAGLTVLLALLVRPIGTTDPAAAFTNDVVAMVIAAAFCFLVFDMVDKRRETDAPVVRKVSRGSEGKDAQPPGWRLELLSYADPVAHRWIAGLLGFAVFVVFVVILYHKWLIPWPPTDAGSL